MTFVRNVTDIASNVSTMMEALYKDKAPSRDAVLLIAGGRVFLPFWHRGFIAFAPSKFLGYRNNRIKLHIRKRSVRDGKDTNRELSRFLGRPEENAEMERRLRAYCEGLGVSLQDHKHSFWPVSSAIGVDGDSKSAIEDLEQDEIGNDSPKYKELVALVYERDSRVRRSVLKRARGRCEYKGCASFLSRRGEPYLEAHHVISLASAGKDRPSNVIALCANHHREAHFGKDWEQMNGEFLKILAKLGAK